MSITDLRHPKYDTKDVAKWRSAFSGGTPFIASYLKQFSTRENTQEFTIRRNMAYVPAFAKAAILEIRNSIYERLGDVTRTGGSQFYQESVAGLNGGVDQQGATMADFIGSSILDDLLVARQIGVFIDRPQDPGITLADVKKPYLYTYKTEDILSWSTDALGQYTSLLLRSTSETLDDTTGLPKGETQEYRHIYLAKSQVAMDIYNSEGTKTATIHLNLAEIPFVLFELSDSLMKDVADYQVALLNLASSDLSYAINANFPFYTEQFSPQADFAGRQTSDGTADSAATSGNTRIETGISKGRRYPKGMERPGFINPSSEPLTASMDKQEVLKAEIRQLLHLALTNIRPQRQSADSKDKDNQGLEAGLAAIGMELAHGERAIAKFWAMYEGTEIATITYPTQYSLRSEEERQAEAKTYTDILPKIPSLTYQKELAKRIVRLTIGSRISTDTLVTIEAEIDGAAVISIDPDVIKTDHEAGFVSTETASKARLYPTGEVEQAKKDHAERAARILMAQTAASAAARGSDDLAGDDDTGAEDEKTASQSADKQVNAKKKVRS